MPVQVFSPKCFGNRTAAYASSSSAEQAGCRGRRPSPAVSSCPGDFTGWALWDVGSLFRYRQHYDEAFRAEFALGYLSVGGSLPEDWFQTARLLDAHRQVATLDA